MNEGGRLLLAAGLSFELRLFKGYGVEQQLHSRESRLWIVIFEQSCKDDFQDKRNSVDVHQLYNLALDLCNAKASIVSDLSSSPTISRRSLGLSLHQTHRSLGSIVRQTSLVFQTQFIRVFEVFRTSFHIP